MDMKEYSKLKETISKVDRFLEKLRKEIQEPAIMAYDSGSVGVCFKKFSNIDKHMTINFADSDVYEYYIKTQIAKDLVVKVTLTLKYCSLFWIFWVLRGKI